MNFERHLGAEPIGGVVVGHEIGCVEASGDFSQNPASGAEIADVREKHFVPIGGDIVREQSVDGAGDESISAGIQRGKLARIRSGRCSQLRQLQTAVFGARPAACRIPVISTWSNVRESIQH